MMLYSKIRTIFVISLIFITAFFGAYFYIQKSQYLNFIEKRYMQTSFFIHKQFRDSHQFRGEPNLNDENLKLFLQESNFKIISNQKEIQKIHHHSIVLKKRKIMRSHIVIKRLKNRLYLSIHHPLFRVLLQDTQKPPFPWVVILSYLSILIFLVALYLWIISSLKPLKELQKQIQKVANGDLSICVKNQGSDEIAEVANAFDNALRKLEALINSRQLFLRTIMHELKTPIAKGKLLNSFLEDEQLNDSYEAVFDRLQLLIEEFSKIEQMLSSSYQLKLSNYNVRDIIEQSLDIMILDEIELEKRVKIVDNLPLIVNSDFELLALGVKNLIDNAIKYSPDGVVIIEINHNNIKIINRGEKFTDDLEQYKQPFNTKADGFGLGLYIVDSITNMLGIKLVYKYKDDRVNMILFL